MIISEPGVDGVFRHVEGLIHYLHGVHDCYVDFVYSSRRSSARLERLVEEVRARGGATLDLTVGNAPGLSDFRAMWRLARMVRERKTDLIHAHSSKAGALARMLGVFFHQSVLYTPHAYYGMGQQGGLKMLIFNWLEKVFYGLGKTIHVSPEETEFARRTLGLDGSRIIEIPNAVDFTLFRPNSNIDERRELRELLGIPSCALVIGSIGRVSLQKDPQTLYRSFEAFCRRVEGASLYLLHVGGGELEALKELAELARQLGIEAKIIRPDYRDDPEIFYRAMDAFCLTSLYEGLPFTGLEALASGLPLILTDAPGLRSFGNTKYGFNGVYYGNVNDPDSLSGAMLAWYQQRDQALNHREVGRKHFSIPEVYAQIVDLYRLESS